MSIQHVIQMFLMIFSGTAILTTIMVVMMSAMMEENRQ
jgi:hypothetical protein|tara:strand:+ start:313 stop:426 length:114 start_codon:yes stop_codon:yes gene_type:complete